MLMKTGILYFTTCFHGFGILRHVDSFVRMLHIYIQVVIFINVIILAKYISVHVTLPDKKVTKVSVAADDIVYAVIKKIKVKNKYKIVKKYLFLIALINTASPDSFIYIPHMSLLLLSAMFDVNLIFLRFYISASNKHKHGGP